MYNILYIHVQTAFCRWNSSLILTSFVYDSVVSDIATYILYMYTVNICCIITSSLWVCVTVCFQILEHYKLLNTRPPLGDRVLAGSCLWVCLSVCLSVCPWVYLRNNTSKLHQMSSARCPWAWLSTPLATFLCTTSCKHMIACRNKDEGRRRAYT